MIAGSGPALSGVNDRLRAVIFVSSTPLAALVTLVLGAFLGVFVWVLVRTVHKGSKGVLRGFLGPSMGF